MATGCGAARDLHVHERIIFTKIVFCQKLLADLAKCGGVYSPNLQIAQAVVQALEMSIEGKKASTVTPHNLVHPVAEEKSSIVG